MVAGETPFSTALKSLIPTPYIHDRPNHRAEQGGGRVRLPLPGLRHGRDAGRDVQRGPQDQGARRGASQDLRLALVVRASAIFGLLDRSAPLAKCT